MNRADQNSDPNLQAPPRLVAELKRASQADLFIPPTVDEAILAAARAALPKPGTRPWFRFRLPSWVATAAAALLLGLFLWLRFIPHPSTVAREDVNHDGKTDILDALVLARGLESGQHATAGLDVNGDGVVNDQDVLWVAAQAVRLEKGGD